MPTDRQRIDSLLDQINEMYKEIEKLSLIILVMETIACPECSEVFERAKAN